MQRIDLYFFCICLVVLIAVTQQCNPPPPVVEGICSEVAEPTEIDPLCGFTAAAWFQFASAQMICELKSAGFMTEEQADSLIVAHNLLPQRKTKADNHGPHRLDSVPPLWRRGP